MKSLELDGKPLFLTQDALGPMEKIATYRVSRDTEKWEQEIMGILHEQHPYLNNYPTRIHMNKTDEESGAGVGQIVLDEKISIPLIIENFKLYPLDLFWYEGQLNPMTKQSLLGVLQETGLGKPVEPGQGETSDVSLYQASQPPYMGRYAYANALTFTEKELEDAISRMGHDGLSYALQSNDTFKNTLSAYAANASDPIAKTASHTKEAKVIDFTPSSTINKAGLYYVAAGFQKLAGFVFDTVVDFSDHVLDGQKLFVGIDSNAAMAMETNIGGISMEKVADTNGPVFDKLQMSDDPHEPGIGFFWMIKKGQAIATVPVKVLYTGSDETNLPFIKIADLTTEGMARKVYPSSDYEGISVHGDTIFMGKEWNWKRCGETVKLASAEKANTMFWPPATVEIRHRAGRFSIHEMEIDEIAKEGEAIESFYGSMAKIFGPVQTLNLMKKAEDEGAVFFTVTSGKPEEGLKKIASAAARLGIRPVNLVREASFIRPTDKPYDFFKFATEVSEEEAATTVDGLLGLNFVTDENLHKFVENTDLLEDCMHIMSKLLLASRIGLQVEQAPIRTALFALEAVVRQMKELRNTTYGSDE